MGPDPAGAVSRDARRRRRLGPYPACVRCGITDVRVLEAHHIGGVANDRKLTEIRCRNCHRLITTQHEDLGVDMEHPDTLMHKLIAMLGGIGATLIAIGEALLDLRQQLVILVGQLDLNLPAWRELPGAQP